MWNEKCLMFKIEREERVGLTRIDAFLSLIYSHVCDCLYARGKSQRKSRNA